METLRAVGKPAPRRRLRSPSPFVLVFATTSRRGLGQAAVEGKTNQRTAIPAHRGRRAEKDGSKGAIVAIDTIALHPAIVGAPAAIIRVAARTRQRTAPRSRARSRQPV